MILISPRILNSAQKQTIRKDSFSDDSDGRLNVNIIQDEEMNDDFLYDSIESRHMNPRTIGRSGSFVEDDVPEGNKIKNASF